MFGVKYLLILLLATSAAAAEPSPKVTLTKLTLGEGAFATAFFTRDGKTFYVQMDGTVYRGNDAGDLAPVKLALDDMTGGVEPRGITADGKLVAYSTSIQTTVIDLATGTRTDVPGWNGAAVGRVEWLRDGQQLFANIATSFEQFPVVTDVAQKKSTMVCSKLKGDAIARVAPDGKHLAVILDGKLMWTGPACDKPKKLAGWTGWIKDVALSPNGAWIAADVDGGAGVGSQVQLGKVTGKAKLIATAKGRTSSNAFWLTDDRLLFEDGGTFEAAFEGNGGDGLFVYAVKTGATQKVALPDPSCFASVLAVPAGGGRALLEVTCGTQRTIALLTP